MLARVKSRLVDFPHQGQNSNRERALRALNAEPVEPLLRLFVRDHRGRVIRIPLSDITRLIGADDYVEVHNGKTPYLVNVTLNEFERRLDPKSFRRVHRSAIVNLDKIITCRRIDRRLQIELSDGSTVVASRAGSHRLRDLVVKR